MQWTGESNVAQRNAVMQCNVERPNVMCTAWRNVAFYKITQVDRARLHKRRLRDKRFLGFPLTEVCRRALCSIATVA